MIVNRYPNNNIRDRWNNRNQAELYRLFFIPLLTLSSLEYLELIHFETIYDSEYEFLYDCI